VRRVYLDTETTGLSPERDELVELALIDDAGGVLLDTLVRPVRLTEWPEAMAIHGITPAMVKDAPTLEQLVPELLAHLTGAHLIIYNAGYDLGFLPAHVQDAPAQLSCAMEAFALHYGEPGYRGGYRWQKLTRAAEYVSHVWEGDPHRARADALAARAVWEYLDRVEREVAP
jgi:DNA polymerase III subunit epsilon